MGEDHEAEIAALTVIGAAANVAALATLDHGHDGFDLGALTISVVIETNLHLPPIATRGRLGRWPTMLGGNDGANAVLVAWFAWGNAVLVEAGSILRFKN